MLEIAFLGASQRSDPPLCVELLKAAPERLRSYIKEVALLSSDQAFALVKSHYIRVDLQRVGEGFAADADDDKVESLMKEARPISSIVVEDLDLGFPAANFVDV